MGQPLTAEGRRDSMFIVKGAVAISRQRLMVLWIRAAGSKSMATSTLGF